MNFRRRARRLGVSVLGVIIVSGFVGCFASHPTPGGTITAPYGIKVEQPANAIESATVDIKVPAAELPPAGTVISLSTGIPADANVVALKEVETTARRPLMWAGIACIIGGLLTATLFKYPTPGGLLALCGGALIGLHTYPWLGMVAAGLGAAAIAIILGYEAKSKEAK